MKAIVDKILLLKLQIMNRFLLFKHRRTIEAWARALENRDQGA
jgi:hypothetical protein